MQSNLFIYYLFWQGLCTVLILYHPVQVNFHLSFVGAGNLGGLPLKMTLFENVKTEKRQNTTRWIRSTATNGFSKIIQERTKYNTNHPMPMLMTTHLGVRSTKKVQQTESEN